ncbi:KAP family P-loop NTPase fold protein [Sediminibacterium sp.]|uniref:KAP family P-loop NTPase fold protein n=1 Tax=Sediminibacterium sp. TaxID=1917865 RepID=UPI003F6FF077
MFYRFTEFSFTIISFSFCPLFKYGDVLVLFFILQWQLALREIVRVEFTPNKESLHNDNSIGEFGEDLLGYNKYAETLAKKILSSNFEKSFAIGINGKWGLGKTSFVDLLKRTVKDKDLIAIDFNPWNSQTPQAIIRDFFNTIEEKIREHHPEIASELVNYANKLAAVNDSTLSKSLQSSVSVIFGYDSLNSLHETINRLLRQWKKKIVVYVDDLDRLDTNEIIEVIRLIRNTADFHNTFFIVCYDKQYISEALKGHNPYNHGLFLEKIFQLEINLPHFKKEILRQVLASKLKKSFDEKYHNEIDRAIFGDSLVMTAVALSWIESMRDVTRLFNSIMLNLSPLLGEVEVKDFIELEILRLKYPMVYEMLFRQKSIFLNFNKEESDNRKYVLRRGKDMPSFIKIPDTEKNEKYLRIYLNNNHENLQITKGEIDRIVDSVENIFQDTIGHFYPSGNFQSVVYPDKFDRYFSYNLFDENLSNNDFTSSIALDLDSIKIKIDEWVSKGLEYELQKRFMEIHEFGSKDEFEKIIRAIFYLANRPSGNTYQTTLGYDGKDLMEKLADYQNKITALYGANGKSKLHSFITSTLTEAQSPFQFESQFVRYVNNKMIDNTMFPLSQEELKSLQILYLKKYADETKKIDLTVFGLFGNTEQTSFISVGGNSYRTDKQFPQEAIDILKELVSIDLNEFIERVIEVEPLHQKLFSISNTAIVLYGSWANFKTYLDSEDEAQWLYLREFKEFFVAFEKERFEKYVPFDFKVIPENRKLRNS